ncbi:hypothetical protein [Exiguobacterium sp. S90]|uniref:hypothetical protein n=1 Tax=Exiguobacterium sp. S90 TaxID=1221231 RepID=UPI001BECF69E|nr:hypothetical protein [Exiguobacterium sp. S90]
MNVFNQYGLEFQKIMEQDNSIDRVLELADLMVKIESSKEWQERDDQMMELYRKVSEARSF